ncbi:unnamed protein product [Durusdinium trenchii]|uniref:EF-hand domain-containing protein n=1 Tax=Durusdinium trenchii TaxID=1381693 RepID=A0ABP0KEN1_9DINO
MYASPAQGFLPQEPVASLASFAYAGAPGAPVVIPSPMPARTSTGQSVSFTPQGHELRHRNRVGEPLLESRSGERPCDEREKYFQLIKAHCDTTLINKPAAVRQLNGKLFPFIVEAFQRHDKDGDGVLNKSEANIFFSLFVSERLGFVHAARGLVTQYTGDAEKASAQILLYQRHKDTMDSKAFEVFDSNEDGYLQLHEAVSAMSIGSEKNEALLKAFGLRADDTDDDTTYWADHYA